jgi:peptidoglycan/xylan/chitin deacetylase (PgdA/CDA1 family)
VQHSDNGGVAVPIVSACPEEGRRMLALTFDDGPSPNTAAVLDVLEAHGGRGTFFVLGESIERDPHHAELLRRAAAAGHEVGNHTYSHPHLGELDETALRTELDRTTALIEQHTGGPPQTVRCPYGDDEERVSRVVAGTTMAAVIHWSVDPEDWSDPAPEEITERVLSEAAPGAIVVMHDGEGRANTAQALATLVPELLRRGFELVTVSELLS